MAQVKENNMCKNCVSPLCSKEELYEILRVNKKPEGYSGYPGAGWCFNDYLDKKETIDNVISAAESNGWSDVADLAKKYKEELVNAMLKFIGLR